MNRNHKAVRDFLSNLPPKRAVAFVDSFFPPDNEAMVVIECDVRRKSCVQVSMERNMSVETVSEFLKAVGNVAQDRAWEVMDELMDTLKIVNEKAYNSVLKKLT